MNFPDTRWTLIAHLSDEAKVGVALDQLCAAYWQPIYAYLLNAGHSHAQAQDLTQNFLGMVVRQRLLERANPVAGKLRAWLLASLRNFLANVRRSNSRQARGGGMEILSFCEKGISSELVALVSPGLSPDEAFDRAWVAVLLRRVFDLLTRQYQEAGKAAEVAALLPWLLDGGDDLQAEAAAKVGMTVSRFRLQLHRLRGRYRELLRQEITATLEHDEDYDEEVAYLFRITGQST